MEHQIKYGPAFAVVTLSLDSGESVMTEAGAMVSMSPGSRCRPARAAPAVC